MASGASAASMVVCSSRALQGLFTKIRATSTCPQEFAFHADRLMTILAEEGIASLPQRDVVVETPCGQYAGVEPAYEKLCVVSIVRAGDSLAASVRKCAPHAAMGKILIQRDEETALPKLFYKKLPLGIEAMQVLLVDPMLATGGSAIMAVEVLLESGVPPENIVFLNVVSCPEGLANMASKFPMVKVVTAAVDEKLDERSYIVPGLGDYGDRYFGTV
jgi:uracil phosphoribosyltransferase